jgi:hypothetical protein
MSSGRNTYVPNLVELCEKRTKASMCVQYLGEDVPDDVLGARRRGERPDVAVVHVRMPAERPQVHETGRDRAPFSASQPSA